MKILLLGATGRTGKWVLKQALDRGLEVCCLARNPNRIEPMPGLTIVEGDPSRNTDLEKAIAGCDTIISVLNIARTSDFPWAKLRTPENYLSEVMSKLVPTAEAKGVKRLIACSAWGAAETRKDIPGWFRWFIDNSNVGVAYRDHERQETIISNSILNWTIIRPVGLTNAAPGQTIQETFENVPKPTLTISRQALADYMLNCLRNDMLIGKKVTISKK